MRKRTIAALAAPVVVALGLSACSSSGGSGSGNGTGNTGNGSASSTQAAQQGGASASGKAVQGASVTLTINGEPTTLDPQARDDGNLRDVDDNIYEKLVTRSPDGSKLEPWLAASLPTHINPTTWEFKLRQGVKFTDGEPFDANSAVYSIKRIIDKKFNSELASSVSTIVDAKAVDQYTLDVITNSPDPILPSRMYFIAMMAPNNSSPAQTPIGTGPYKLQTWAHGDHITLVANPDYWGTKPSITTATFNYPQESGTRLAQLLSGKTDLVTNLLPTDAKQAPQLLVAPGQNESLMILNAESGVTADLKVRQAMNYAVDSAQLAKKLFDGYATPESCQIMDKSWFGYNPSLQPMSYDLNKAKQLIQQAGATGKTVNMVADASGRWLEDRDIAQAVAQAWRAIGLKVNVQLLQFNQYLDKLFNQPQRPDAIILYTDNSLFDADRTVTTYYAHGGSGASNTDPQIVQLADQARSNLDTTSRLQEYNQIMQIGCDQALFWFGLHVQDLYGASKRVHWTPRADSQIYVADMSVSS
jgi:peptide/nickel transport system substrate-binding protein